jgi:hypothetical protein
MPTLVVMDFADSFSDGLLSSLVGAEALSCFVRVASTSCERADLSWSLQMVVK